MYAWFALAALAVAEPVAIQPATPVVVAEHRVALTAEAWTGGVAEPDALRWEYAAGASIWSSAIPHDWAPYQALCFTLEVNTPAGCRLTLVIGSEDPGAEGPDYYSFSLPGDWSGARTCTVPFNELEAVRQPRGFGQIDRVTFHNDWGRTGKANPATVVRLRDLRLVRWTAGPDRGPRLGDAELFALLDPAVPGLAPALGAAQVADWPRARRELARYLRERTSPAWFRPAADRPTRGLPPQSRRATAGSGGQFVARLPLPKPATEWSLVRVSRSQFQPRGRPVGWDWVSGLSLSLSSPPGSGAEPILFVDDCRLVGGDRTAALGDFESEASGWTGLTPTVEAAHGGRAAGTWWFHGVYPKAICRRFPADWSWADALEFWVRPGAAAGQELVVTAESAYPDTAAADAILDHRFAMSAFRDKPYDFGPRIDWAANPMREGESATVEWNAQLNRHFHFATLVQAYRQTGDPKYAREVARQMNAWVEDNPVLLTRSGNSPYHHAWETLNTAIRLGGTWPEALFGCLDSPEFADDTLASVLASVVEQVRHLLRYPSGGNWLTAESLGVYTAGVLFPEFREAALWRQTGLGRLHTQLLDEVYPDGMEYELALGYNNWVLAEYLQVLALARLTGREAEVPPDYAARIGKMFAYLMADSMPNGTAFGLNDSGNADVRELLVQGCRYFPDRQDFVYALSAGRAGRRPDSDSFGLPYTGHYIMRSDWGLDARLLHIDAGPFGTGHQHEDKLHLSLFAYGRLLLPDGGNFMYDRSRWRAYVLLSRSHNTVLVDGLDQCRRGDRSANAWPQPWTAAPPADSDTRWVSVPGLDWLDAGYRGAYREYVDPLAPKRAPLTLTTVTHRRQVLFAKPDLWIVRDLLAATDPARHTADVLYHVNADGAATAAGAGVVAESAGAPGLQIATPDGDATTAAVLEPSMEPPVQGWSTVAGQPRPGVPMRALPTAVFRQEWTGRGEVVTVLAPFAAGAAPPVVACRRLPAPDGVSAVRIDLRSGASLLWVANTTGGPVEVDGLHTDAEAACACLSPAADLRLAMVNGTRLETGSARLALDRPGSACLSSVTAGTRALAAQGATQVRLRLPDLDLATVTIHRLDREEHRLEAVAAGRDAGDLVVTLAVGAAYEVNSGGSPLDQARADRDNRARTQRLGLHAPVRPGPVLPPTSGVRIVVQAENLAAQGGGSVEITDRKVGADGKAFLHWDTPGHWLEYRFRVPADGEYRLALRYCLHEGRAVRAVLVDGAFPAAGAQDTEWEPTGGWSSTADDWRTAGVRSPQDGAPMPLYLRAGEHVLRLVNVANSLNLDYLVVHSPDTTP